MLAAPVATILCYHEVDPETAVHSTVPRQSATGDEKTEMRRYTVTPANFEAQLDFLQQNDYHVIPLATLVEYLEGGSDTLPPRAVVITVDDGWACAFTDIGPALRKRGMPFTLFVYPRIVGRGSHALSWQQIAELACLGADVESHTVTHSFLTRTDPQFLRHELEDSRLEIEQHTGTAVQFLSYPYGDYNATVAADAARFGYRAAVTTERGPISRDTPPMQLKRYLLHNDTTLDELKTFLLP
jgi:peptidoglycan/xylan/chitin deacetylase (PgdA/CDA1 family)